MNRGKAYNDAAAKIDRRKLYDTAEALEMVKDLSTAKFDETVEIHIKLGVAPATLISR